MNEEEEEEKGNCETKKNFNFNLSKGKKKITKLDIFYWGSYLNLIYNENFSRIKLNLQVDHSL